MLSHFLFFFVIFGISNVAAEESVCGISASVERYKIFNPNRIFGGENSNEGDFPWYIWMKTDDGGCSGTILNEKWILTAAHCVNSTVNVNIYYGSVNWTVMKTQSIKALQYFVHPLYVTGANDIALIELDGKLEFSETVQPICLDQNIEAKPYEILTQIGMGDSFKQTKIGDIEFITQNILQDAPIAYIMNDLCGTDEKRKICVGGINHASLPGDSGGPLMAIRENKWFQIGVTSALGWKRVENERISINVTDYYMKVSYYCDWIKETTKNEINC